MSASKIYHKLVLQTCCATVAVCCSGCGESSTPAKSAKQTDSPVEVTRSEAATQVHRLESEKRSPFDAFVYVNRIPIEPEAEETQEDLAGRILGRLANQEGRILIKLPPGMDRDAYDGFKIAIAGGAGASAQSCIACHQLPELANSTSESPVSSIRNLSVSAEKLAEILKNESHRELRFEQNESGQIVAFLNSLSDVTDSEFRDLIIKATVDTTEENP